MWRVFVLVALGCAPSLTQTSGTLRPVRPRARAVLVPGLALELPHGWVVRKLAADTVEIRTYREVVKLVFYRVEPIVGDLRHWGLLEHMRHARYQRASCGVELLVERDLRGVLRIPDGRALRFQQTEFVWIMGSSRWLFSMLSPTCDGLE